MAHLLLKSSYMTIFLWCVYYIYDLMFHFLFPPHRLHVQYKTLPVSYKVLDLKWAIYQKCWLALEEEETAIEKCASRKTAQSYQGR